MTPHRLVRLFPRTWRARYGAEFQVLLESSPLTRRDSVDVLRRAADEWLARTMIGRIIVGTSLAVAGTVLAAGLAAVSPLELQQWSWPMVLALAFGMVEIGMACRFLWCALMRERIPAREQRNWMFALFLTSVAAQWGARVVVPESGYASQAPMLFAMWCVFVQSSMQTLAMSRILPRGYEASRLRTRPSARPLGLS
jgi:hypothetical protein